MENMLEQIEKKINEYFPAAWSKEDMVFWFGDARFSFDGDALNKNINDPIREFLLRGGKRLRPVLFLKSLQLFGLPWHQYVDVAVALELAHNGTLIIDDIEDGAVLRRGKPVSHRLFGLDVAINVGNAMYFMPLRILEKRTYENDSQKLQVFQVYVQEMLNVHAGQAMDIRWHGHPKAVSLEEYLQMCLLKSGGLIGMAARMACVLANKDEAFQKDFKHFAQMAGIAFQIKDDALEFTADAKMFGKSFGNDISEGKMSLPVIFALQVLPEKKKIRLLKILGLHTKKRRLLKEGMEIIRQSGAVEKSLHYGDELIDKAWQEIEPKLPSSNPAALEEFKQLTYFLVKRQK